MADRHEMHEHNTQLQHRLAELFQQRRADDTHRDDPVTTDQEKRYLNYMGDYISVRSHGVVLLDNIRIMVIVWRLRGNIMRTAPCWVV